MANRVVAIYNADWSANPEIGNITFDGWDIDIGDDLIAEIVEGSDPNGNPSNTGDNYAASYTSMAAMEAAENGSFASVLIKSYGNARSSTGLWDTDAYILKSTAADHTLQIDNDHDATEFLSITFDAVQFQQSGANNNLFIRSLSYSKNTTFLRCYFYHSDGTSNNVYTNLADTTNLNVLFVNCILQDGINGVQTAGGFNSFKLCNCTVFDVAGDAIECNSLDIVCVNCALFNNIDDWQDAFTTAPIFCASDDNDIGTNKVDISPGGTELDDWHNAFTNPDASPPDVTIKDTSSVLYQAGESQTNDSDVPSDDIAGTARVDGSESIGAFEFAAAGTASPTSVLYGPLCGPLAGPI